MCAHTLCGSSANRAGLRHSRFSSRLAPFAPAALCLTANAEPPSSSRHGLPMQSAQLPFVDTANEMRVHVITTPKKFLRLPSVIEATIWSGATVWGGEVKAGVLSAPIPIRPESEAWDAAEIAHGSSAASAPAAVAPDRL